MSTGGVHGHKENTQENKWNWVCSSILVVKTQNSASSESSDKSFTKRSCCASHVCHTSLLIRCQVELRPVNACKWSILHHNNKTWTSANEVYYTAALQYSNIPTQDILPTPAAFSSCIIETHRDQIRDGIDNRHVQQVSLLIQDITWTHMPHRTIHRQTVT